MPVSPWAYRLDRQVRAGRTAGDEQRAGFGAIVRGVGPDPGNRAAHVGHLAGQSHVRLQLPHPVGISTTAWLVGVAMGLAAAFLASQPTQWLRMDDRVSTRVLLLLAWARTPWLTDVANGINAAGSGWGVTVLGVSVVALTMTFRRWRHLLVFLCSLGFLQVAGTFIYLGLSRPRPYGVPIIARWDGSSGGSPPVALLTIFLMGIVYCLAVPGRTRTYTKAAVALVIAVFCLARLYLGVDHPGDVLLGAAFAVAIARAQPMGPCSLKRGQLS
jgi:membrane-associated phospholipid phosphatase